MSPHFDTDQTKEDPRLSSCDLYVFEGRSGTTVMAMTSNADAGISSPVALHPEGLYAIRFDMDGDAKEDVVFEFRFGEPRHAHGEERRHIQSFKVIRAAADQAKGLDGEVLTEGQTGEIVDAGEVRAFAGLAPELWAADAFAFFTALTNLLTEDKYDPKTFEHRENLFQNRNVMAIVHAGFPADDEKIIEPAIAAIAADDRLAPKEFTRSTPHQGRLMPTEKVGVP